MDKLGAYELTGHLTSQNSGYSVWGFGKRDDKDFFIKQFLTPKYPENDTISSPERLQKKKEQCSLFEKQKLSIYKAVNDNSDGNAVRISEFFRIDSKYYISMRKIEALPWGVSDVAARPSKEVRRLCAVIAHGIASIHRGHVIHADLKHDNVLFMETASKSVTAKIIDFDSSFLETDPPAQGEDIIGDLVYFSPEACMHIWGNKVALTCKMDVFALGVLFHQYFAGGELPCFNRETNAYCGEAVAKGEKLTLSSQIPDDLRDMFERMLDAEPSKRPSAQEVYEKLIDFEITIKPIAEEEKETDNREETPPISIPPIAPTTVDGNPFFTPGDL